MISRMSLASRWMEIGKAIPQLVQFRGVVRRFLDDFAQSLLAGGGDPDLALAEFLEVARQSVEVEDQFAAGCDVLTGLVDQEQNVLMAGLAPADIDDLLGEIADCLGLLRSSANP